MIPLPPDPAQTHPPDRPVGTDPGSPLWGRHLPPGPSERDILDQLSAAGLRSTSHELKLVRIPRNPLRWDYFMRAAFLVMAGPQTLCRLMVGRTLADLHRRSVEFSDACPEIACRPLLWHQSGGWDYLATEHFAGADLETLVRDGRLTAADALGHARRVVAALEKTVLPSTSDLAVQEMNRLFAQVCALPLFDGFDQTFLDGFVFPAMRAGLTTETPTTRWTNGDVIPRNILVDAAGAVRLVDYEFAERTHFFAADGWRWRSFSKLPAEAGGLPGLDEGLTEKPWLEAFFLLRQVAHQYAINGAHIAVEDSRQAVERLIAFAVATHAGFRTSAFFRALVAGSAAAESRAPTRTPRRTWAQLYWSSDGNYNEARSQRQEYAADTEVALSFVIRQGSGPLKLRFDPADAPGLLTITGIRIQDAKSRKLLLSFNEKTGWDGIRLEAGLMRLPGPAVLRLLSLNQDPHFALPDAAIEGETGDLTCDVGLRFSSDMTDLPRLLSAS